MLPPSDVEVGVRVLLNYTSLDDNSRQLRSILTGVGLSHMLSNWNLQEQSQAKSKRGIIRGGGQGAAGVCVTLITA